jgi:hypothetical protein
MASSAFASEAALLLLLLLTELKGSALAKELDGE